jgi:hypothetical protein
MYGLVWASGLLMSTLWTECPMDNERNCILWTAIRIHSDTVTRSWGPLSCHSSAAIHHLMFRHDNARLCDARICTQFLEAENVPVLPWPAYSPDMSPIEHVYGSTAYFSSRQYVELCRAAWGKWWSHQILTGFLIHDPTFFFLKVPVTNMHICIPSHVKSIDWFSNEL